MRPRVFNCTYALASDDIVRLPKRQRAAARRRRDAREARSAGAMAADNVAAVLIGRPQRAIVTPEVRGGPHKGSD